MPGQKSLLDDAVLRCSQEEGREDQLLPSLKALAAHKNPSAEP